MDMLISYLLLWGVIFWWSHAPRRETARRFLLTSASAAFILGCFELPVLTHLIDFRLALGTPIVQPWAHPENLLDATLLHVHRQHSRVHWQGIEYRYDRHGFRNESDLAAADIVVLGDSIIEGWNVSAADLLTAHLAKQLQASVANLGQSWYGPQQELEVLRRYGLPLRPKTVVWAFFEENDLYDWHRYQEATRDWATVSRQLLSFPQRSFTRNAVLAVRRLIKGETPESTHYGWPPELTGMFTESSGRTTLIYFRAAGHYLSAEELRALEGIRSIFREADALCRANAASFLVVFVPDKFRVYKQFIQLDPESRLRYWVINDLPQRLEALVREEASHAAFLDLTPALTEEASRGSLVYYADDSHWSPVGHHVAATAVAHALTHREIATRISGGI
jgi:hypothetical protein